VSHKPNFHDHGMENVLAEHSHNETIQVSRYWCLMNTIVPQYKPVLVLLYIIPAFW